MGDRYRGPRDRDRDREDGNIEFFGAGESYRPGGHSGIGPYRPGGRAADTWSSDRRDVRDQRDTRRDDRRDDRRDGRDERREDIDSYIPPTSARARRSRSPPFRRRSRSPPPRDRNDLFPDHTRSPPRRYSPRRDDRARSPPRRRSRSPMSRPRSPPRSRDYSPPRSPRRDRSPDRRFDRARSPRRYSPPRDGRRFRSRSRSPRKSYGDDNWRRRSPSPRAESSNPSRRSSPPVHPDRTSMVGSAPRSPAYRNSPQPVPYRDRNDYQNGDSFQPPTGPSRNASYDRPPPSGPARSFSASQTPPTGPSMSAHNRPAIPTQPRGTPARFEPPRREYSNPSLRGRTSLTYRAPTAPRPPVYGDSVPAGPAASPTGPPSGPRAGGFGRGEPPSAPSRGSYSGRGDYGFRGNSSSSTTYPRTQRFNTVQQHLSTVEKLVPGGKLLPSGLPSDQERKLRQLEADAEKLRLEMAEKQKVKREAINEFEVRERESQREMLRSGLAEDSLEKLMEGDEEMAAF